MNKINLIPATESDVNRLTDLICELATYEKIPHTDKTLLQQNLIKHGFCDHPKFYAALAYYGEDLAGYILYSFIFSGSQARPYLFLEDLFVRQSFRRKGIATICMEYLTEIARSNDCCRIEWGVLKWNNDAQKFYEKIKAKITDNSFKVILTDI